MGFKTLRNFSDSELIFDDEQTRLILQTIFKNHLDVVDMLSIDRKVRNFAQGLLLETIDASYSMGYISTLTDSLIQPSLSVRKVLSDFRDGALMHWFEHATRKDLLSIKIYETVRRQLELNFSPFLKMLAQGGSVLENVSAIVAYRQNYYLKG
ncbi:MAG: hypothetical protein VX185_16115 [Pseudomonadota bacterium]|nr:hypothetical protein [Pseudomonadota bacterium]